jgi:hypothetical protein
MYDQNYGAKPQHQQQYIVEEARIGCCDCPDTRLDSVHALLLRIIGVICIIFGLIEFGVGGAIHNYLTNVTYGAWWCAILVIAAGITAVVSLDRKWVVSTCVFASVSCLITLVGTVLDGIQSTKFLALTACSSNGKYNYGDAADYNAADACELSFNSVDNGCYCVSKGGNNCAEYLLSPFAVEYKQNCGNILGNYANMLSASTAICVFSLIFVFFLAVLSCIILVCPSRTVGARGKSNEGTIEVGVTGDAHT